MKNRLITLAAIAALISMPAIYGQDEAPKDAPKHEKGKGPIAMADKDGDGMLSKEEFLTLPMNKEDPAKAEAKFTELDKDGDGKLSADELKAGMKGKGKKEKKAE